MLTALGNTLDTPWPLERYEFALKKHRAFLPVRDLLLGLHREQCGPTCKHWTDAIQAMGDGAE